MGYNAQTLIYWQLGTPPTYASGPAKVGNGATTALSAGAASWQFSTGFGRSPNREGAAEADSTSAVR